MVRFGPSGNSKIFYEKGYKSSVEAPKFLRELGLSCYEYDNGDVKLYDLRMDQLKWETNLKNGTQLDIGSKEYVEQKELIEACKNHKI